MHTIHTTWHSGMAFEAQIGNHSIRMDTTGEGGKDTGASPKKLMLAALAGCTGIDVLSILDKMKVIFTDFIIDIEASLKDEHPKIYKDVRIRYAIKMDVADQPKMRRAVELSQQKYCGVYAMFESFCSITTQVDFIA